MKVIMKSEMKDEKYTYSIDKNTLYAYCIKYPERIKLFVSFAQGIGSVHCNADTNCRDCIGSRPRDFLKSSHRDNCYIIHVDLIRIVNKADNQKGK